MRIGITLSLAQPLWESGRNQTALHLAEMMSALDHTVVFLHSGLHPWWNTYPLPSYATEQSYADPWEQPLDLLIDMDGVLPVPIRKCLTTHPSSSPSPSSSLSPTPTRVVAFFRTFLQFAEMDASVYLETPISSRSMEGIHEIWCWDILNPAETLPSIQTMFPQQPIRSVPFFWSPTLTNHVTTSQRAFAFPPEPNWTIHVAEKNTNESSAVIPLVAIREATLRLTIKSASLQYHIHNLDPIKDNRFLKENVLGPIELSTLPVSLAPKVPFHEWTRTANHLFFSHSRFTPLRLSLLSLIWMGIPLFHNSPVLRDLHPTLRDGYYSGNCITEWVACLQRFLDDPTAWWKHQKERRAAILQRFGLPVHREAWRGIMDSFLSSPSLLPSSSSSAQMPQLPQLAQSPKAAVHILFSDMWPGFNPETNFLLDTLRHHAPHLTLHGALQQQQTSTQEPDLVIVGPYSEKWRTLFLSLPPSIPKIFFSAENWELPSHPKDNDPFSLYLLSSPDPIHPRHFRLPVWMTFIDWFNPRTTLPPQTTDNPIRLPLHFATHPHPIPFQDRTEFCAFVVSNPTQPFRNEAFQALHQYKPVNSGGALYNNIGGPLALLYPGGGGGDLSKHAFFTKHRFTLSAENAQRKGYITEKVLHAKMAGAVPLYWGDADTDEDFAPHSIVNISHLPSPNDIVSLIQRLEAHPEFCARIAATPLLNPEKATKALTLLRSLSERILALLVTRAPPSPLFASIRVINLDRRRDRWDALLQAEPSLAETSSPLSPSILRLSAVDGKTLRLTPSLYKLFQHNTFHWKKGVIGCNLSHMMAWSAIQKQGQTQAKQQENPYHLVLEDDVRFHPEWQARWAAARPHIPADADLLYLGGVLPPNQPALPLALAPVNAHWARIQPNTFFTPTPAPVFHFCAYSYVLTPTGATKLMNHLRHSTQKYYTVSDHMLGSPLIGLTTYVMTPLLTHCFQEDDPAYRSSQFNQLQRTDTFDSDLWNNTDAFTPPTSLTTLYYLSSEASPPHLYEHLWLEDMFHTMIDLQPLPPPSEPIDPSAWCLVQRPRVAEWLSALKARPTSSFRLLHLSDEFGSDPTDELYALPNVKAVIRTYPLSCQMSLSKPNPPIHILPLGYHHKAPQEKSSVPFSQRTLTWSFHGTEWYDRRAQLTPLLASSFPPYDLRLQPDWAHPTATTESDYLHALTQSKFCPILRGNHPETFRFYEALEGNTLPVTTITDRVFIETVEKELALSELYPWTQPEEAIRVLLATPEEGDRIQRILQTRWEEWKERIRGMLRVVRSS